MLQMAKRRVCVSVCVVSLLYKSQVLQALSLRLHSQGFDKSSSSKMPLFPLFHYVLLSIIRDFCSYEIQMECVAEL